SIRRQATKGSTMSVLRTASRAALLAALVCPALVQGAAAQTYPSQNVTVVVAFAAGGIADVIARLVGQKLTERLGQTIVVANRGGIFLPRSREAQAGACAFHRRRALGHGRDRKPYRCARPDLADGDAAYRLGRVARHRACERQPQCGGARRAHLWRDGLAER